MTFGVLSSWFEFFKCGECSITGLVQRVEEAVTKGLVEFAPAFLRGVQLND